MAVIAICLVYLTRSFGTSLRALSQARRYEAALQIAEGELRRVEAAYELSQSTPLPQEGVVSTASGQFRWAATAEPFVQAPHQVLNERPLLQRLTLTVSEDATAAPIRVSLSTLVLARSTTP